VRPAAAVPIVSEAHFFVAAEEERLRAMHAAQDAESGERRLEHALVVTNLLQKQISRITQDVMPTIQEAPESARRDEAIAWIKAWLDLATAAVAEWGGWQERLVEHVGRARAEEVASGPATERIRAVVEEAQRRHLATEVAVLPPPPPVRDPAPSAGLASPERPPPRPAPPAGVAPASPSAPARDAPVEYEALLGQIAAGGVELRGLARKVEAAAETAGFRRRKDAKLRARTFQALAERVLADDRLTEAEEHELLSVAHALGYRDDDIASSFGDLLNRLLVCRINDGRLPEVTSPRLIAKPGEIVHLETRAELMKEVVHREYRGGSSGVSFPIAPGVRFRTGSTRGRSVVTGTSLQAADAGVLSVTDARLVFQGQKKTQESRLDRLTGFDVYTDGIRIGVSNRQTASLYRVDSGIVVGALVNVAAQRKLYG
jgi:hypothetical protein